jgi:hypothetical protein
VRGIQPTVDSWRRAHPRRGDGRRSGGRSGSSAREWWAAGRERLRRFWRHEPGSRGGEPVSVVVVRRGVPALGAVAPGLRFRGGRSPIPAKHTRCRGCGYLRRRPDSPSARRTPPVTLLVRRGTRPAARNASPRLRCHRARRPRRCRGRALLGRAASETTYDGPCSGPCAGISQVRGVGSTVVQSR